MSLKLGTQTASLSNHIYSRATIGQPEPVVGMGATVLCWTDRHAATITKVETIRRRIHLEVREDKVKRKDNNGLSESQDWECTTNPEGRLYTFRQNENGGWQAVWLNPKTNRWSRADGEGLLIGQRRHYHDFSF